MIELVDAINSDKQNRSTLHISAAILGYYSDREGFLNALARVDKKEDLLFVTNNDCIVDSISVSFDSQISDDQEEIEQFDQEQDSEDEELEKEDDQMGELIEFIQFSQLSLIGKFRDVVITLWVLIVILIVKFFFF